MRMHPFPLSAHTYMKSSLRTRLVNRLISSSTSSFRSTLRRWSSFKSSNGTSSSCVCVEIKKKGSTICFLYTPFSQSDTRPDSKELGRLSKSTPITPPLLLRTSKMLVSFLFKLAKRFSGSLEASAPSSFPLLPKPFPPPLLPPLPPLRRPARLTAKGCTLAPLRLRHDDEGKADGKRKAWVV
jgi:hypothetical protein